MPRTKKQSEYEIAFINVDSGCITIGDSTSVKIPIRIDGRYPIFVKKSNDGQWINYIKISLTKESRI